MFHSAGGSGTRRIFRPAAGVTSRPRRHIHACAGVMLLETLESAAVRGQQPLAEVLGFGASGDAFHVSQPAPGGAGAALAMRRALRDGGTSPEHVAHINAHASGTGIGDSRELAALEQVRLRGRATGAAVGALRTAPDRMWPRHPPAQQERPPYTSPPCMLFRCRRSGAAPHASIAVGLPCACMHGVPTASRRSCWGQCVAATPMLRRSRAVPAARSCIEAESG